VHGLLAVSRTSVALFLVLWANLSGTPSPVMDPPMDGGPALSCGIRLAPLRLNGASRATLTCWVAGAPTDDTGFSVQVFKAGSDGTAHPLDSAAADGILSDGAGVCTIAVSDLAGSPLIAGLSVAGTFQPSGTPIGPTTISPTIAGI
jgi:hypothetical protein